MSIGAKLSSWKLMTFGIVGRAEHEHPQADDAERHELPGAELRANAHGLPHTLGDTEHRAPRARVALDLGVARAGLATDDLEARLGRGRDHGQTCKLGGD